ncbi:MAG: NAD-dependent epimerase/dehydratase family protein [Myxococcales bacterium]|nr:NAD(P)H-binding protein [Myxococcales bacterium]
MNVFVAGASGVLGRRLIGLLAGRGHDVRGLARSAGGEERVRRAGGTPVAADLFDGESLARAADGCEVLIHAATSIPQKKRVSLADFAANDRIRREGTRALLDCARAVGARRVVFQSIVWAARPADGAPFDETSAPGPDPVARSALDGERMIADAGYSTLRCGWFYGADAGTRALAESLRRGRVAAIRGAARLSFLHLDDAAAAFAIAAERAGPGLWHVVDDEPATSADFFRALADRIGAPAPRSVRKWSARLAAGRMSVDFLCTPMVTTAAKFKRDFRWMPRYPSYRQGLDQIVAQWTQDAAHGRP